MFCSGPVCYDVLKAAADLEGVAVVDLVSIKPLDVKTVRATVEACGGRFLVVEEGCVQGGTGSAVLETLKDLDFPLRFDLLGIPDTFIEHGPLKYLKSTIGIDLEGLRSKIRSLL